MLEDGFSVIRCDLAVKAVAQRVNRAANQSKVLWWWRLAPVVFHARCSAASAKAVLFGPTVALGAVVPGRVILSCATMSPDAAAEFGAHTTASAHNYIDALISGGAVGAGAGRLTIIAFSGNSWMFIMTAAAEIGRDATTAGDAIVKRSPICAIRQGKRV